MTRAFGTTVLAAIIVSAIPATAHHSHALYFENSAITLEGEIERMAWVNPHVLLYLRSKNTKGQSETWVLQGSSPGNALQKLGSMKDRLKPGAVISARVNPPRNPLFVNDAETVLLTRPDDARKSSHIVAAGEIRFSNGDVVSLGGGPKF